MFTEILQVDYRSGIHTDGSKDVFKLGHLKSKTVGNLLCFPSWEIPDMKKSGFEIVQAYMAWKIQKISEVPTAMAILLMF